MNQKGLQNQRITTNMKNLGTSALAGPYTVYYLTQQVIVFRCHRRLHLQAQSSTIRFCHPPRRNCMGIVQPMAIHRYLVGGPRSPPAENLC